jgi:predicted outer membrane repeat protein
MASSLVTSASGLGAEIAFIDAGILHPSSLSSQFKAGTEIHLLDAGGDAIDQITQILSSRSNISAVHILSHGSNGALQLGGETISDLSEYDADLKLWSDSLTADADILLYGCNVAADASGKRFVNDLARQTGADVAASDDLTGLGGDWDLEYQTGSVETIAIADTTYQGTLANFFVTSTSDVVSATDNVLTLREAITQANTQAGTDNIFFSVNGTITLTGGELGISSNINLYGNGVPSLTISGNNVGRVFNVDSGNVLLSGLTIAKGSAFDGGGIRNNGNLTVQFCTFSGNSAYGGGGIANGGSLTVNNSTFSSNSAVTGGGIVNGGSLTVNNSTFSGNSATERGGGINNVGILTVNSSTFSGNSAMKEGGGIYNSRGVLRVTSSYFLNNRAADGGGIANIEGGTSTLIGNVIRQNSATNRGGGVYTDSSGTVYLQRNNISANTAATGVDLFGAFVSGTATPGSFGFNIIGKGGGFTGIVNGVSGNVILMP